MRRLRFGLVVLLGILAYILVKVSSKSDFIFFANLNPQPNIVFILADDLGWRDLSIYGSTYYLTPNLDALAQRGVRFTDAYAACPLCTPTRASVLTGQYPGRLHMTAANGHLPIVDDSFGPSGGVGPIKFSTIEPDVVNHLPDDTITIGEAFKRSSYSTAFMGKWHTGTDPYLPENFGFDVVVGARGEPGPLGGSYFDLVATRLPTVNPSGEVYPEATNVSKVLVDYAIDFVEKETSQDNPYFLHLSLYDVHAPYSADPQKIAAFQGKTDPQGNQKSPTMAAMIQEMDEQLGRLVNTIDSSKKGRETIIVFYSDNGGNMYDYIDSNVVPTNNAPLRGGKASAYEGGIRVPAFVVWPGVTKANTVSNAVISTIDLYPTFMDMIGQAPPSEQLLDGISIKPALEGKRLNRESVFFHFPHDPPHVPETFAHTAVRSGDWKLIQIYGSGDFNENYWELYNLSQDIGEQNNLYYEEAEIAEKLKAELEQHIVSTGSNVAKKNQNFYHYTWDFASSPDDWSTQNDSVNLRAENHALLANFTNDSALFVTSSNNLDVYLDKFSAIQFRVLNSSSVNSVNLGLATYENNSFSINREISIEANSNSFQTYTIPLNAFTGWDSNNRLKQLRLSFSEGVKTGAIAFDYIKLVEGYSWNFGKAASSDNWLAINDLGNLSNGGGIFNLDITGSDPYLHSPNSLMIDASYYRYVRICLQNQTNASSGALYFSPINQSFENNFINFPVTPNSANPEDIIVDMAQHPNWSGIIKQLRLDPIQQNDVTTGQINIDSISLLTPVAKHWHFTIDGNEMGWAASPNNHLSNLIASAGTLKGDIVDTDPFIRSLTNLYIDTSQIKTLKLALLNNTNSTFGDLYFQTTNSRGYDANKKISFATTPNSGSFEEISISLSDHPLWNGELVGLRVDPANGVNAGSFEIDYIYLE